MRCRAHGQCLRANRGKRGLARVLSGARIQQSKSQPNSAASRYPNVAALAAPIGLAATIKLLF